jgi:short-subunit dehydrogenase
MKRNHPWSTLLVIGGASDIGRAIGRAHAEAGGSLVLAGRNAAALEREAQDIRTRTGASVEVRLVDMLKPEAFKAFVEGFPELPDAVVCSVGVMGEEAAARRDVALASEIMRSNYEGPALILSLFAEAFAARGSGWIVGISSVAGDRGRGSNYVYGSAKAGFTAFLSGLRNRCAPCGVRVMTVKPGFVRTKMTRHLALPGPITATPSEIAEGVLNAVRRNRDVVYLRAIWRLIMLIIIHLPETVFKRTRL